jgi:hypothetical protein
MFMIEVLFFIGLKLERIGLVSFEKYSNIPGISSEMISEYLLKVRNLILLF